MKKAIFILIIFILFTGQIFAQPGNFAVKIIQVYPSGGVVYSNRYNLSSELDKAEATLRNQYIGKEANYIMELTRPSGKETKAIQNINWILIENGIKKNRKEKPRVEISYEKPTTIKIYECNNNGTPKGQENTINYDHRYEFLKNGEKTKTSGYMPLDKCELSANEYFTKNKVDTLFCEMKIYNSQGIVINSTINNSKTYDEYLAKQEQVIDSVKQDSIKVEIETPQIITGTNTDYNRQDINKQLKQLQKEADSLKKGDEKFRRNMNIIVGKADNIISIMKIDPKKDFNRNKYFEGDLEDLKKGIKELITINKKMK